MSRTIRRPFTLLAVVGLTVVGMLVVAQSASAAFLRPLGATPYSAPLVVPFKECTTPNTAHNAANLPGASCTPPLVGGTPPALPSLPPGPLRLTIGNPN